MKTIIIIPSRMASTRLPGKPLVKIEGIPMVQRVWQQAISANLGDVYVACSEVEVFDLIHNLGGNAILTDPFLPSGTDRIYSAFKKIKNSSEIQCVINLQGDMPLINPKHIEKVIEPLMHNYSIATLATTLKENEIDNQNITKVVVDWEENNIGEAKEFFRLKNKINKNTYHHVGIYCYFVNALESFVKLPKSINENNLKLEQYRALDSGIRIGITYVHEIPPSIDTKEDLINAKSIIKGKV